MCKYAPTQNVSDKPRSGKLRTNDAHGDRGIYTPCSSSPEGEHHIVQRHQWETQNRVSMSKLEGAVRTRLNDAMSMQPDILYCLYSTNWLSKMIQIQNSLGPENLVWCEFLFHTFEGRTCLWKIRPITHAHRNVLETTPFGWWFIMVWGRCILYGCEIYLVDNAKGSKYKDSFFYGVAVSSFDNHILRIYTSVHG